MLRAAPWFWSRAQEVRWPTASRKYNHIAAVLLRYDDSSLSRRCSKHRLMAGRPE